MQGLDNMAGDGEVPDLILDLGHNRIFKRLVVLEIARIAGPQAQALTGFEMNTIGEGELHRAGKIVMPARTPLGKFSRQVGLHASHDAPVSGLRCADALFHEHLDPYLVIVNGGKSSAQASELGHLAEELFRILAVDAYRKRRLA